MEGTQLKSWPGLKYSQTYIRIVNQLSAWSNLSISFSNSMFTDHLVIWCYVFWANNDVINL